MTGHALLILRRQSRQCPSMLVAGTALLIDGLRRIKCRGKILRGKLVVRVMTEEAVVVFLPTVNRLAAMRSMLQILHHFVVATSALIILKEVVHRPVDVCTLGVRSVCENERGPPC
jgi:hypothetical protein